MSRISQLAAQAKDRKEIFVPVPEWTPPEGPDVYIGIRTMSGEQRSDYIARLIETDDDPDARRSIEMLIMVECCFDPEDGAPAFTEDDIPMLLTKSGSVVFRLSANCVRINELDRNAEERLGKDSLASVPTAAPEVVIPSDASTTNSPENSEG